MTWAGEKCLHIVGLAGKKLLESFQVKFVWGIYDQKTALIVAELAIGGIVVAAAEAWGTKWTRLDFYTVCTVCPA